MKIWNCYDGLASQSWFYTDDKRIALKDKGAFLSSYLSFPLIGPSLPRYPVHPKIMSMNMN
jgi:hypothetical protein